MPTTGPILVKLLLCACRSSGSLDDLDSQLNPVDLPEQFLKQEF